MNVENIKMTALVQGGLGAEREISLMSARAVATAFDELNIPYKVISAGKDIAGRLSDLKPDLAFLAVHGKYAEDGALQGICEYLKIPYTGSGVLSSALCMDKCVFKDLISRYKIPTARYQNMNFSQADTARNLNIPFPLVVKPSREGSSLGISICRKKREWEPALEKALKYDNKILLESYIKGRELAVSFVEGRMLTPVEIVPSSEFYDYKSKYHSSKTQYILPPRLNKQVIQQCKKWVLKTADILRINSYCRMDFIIQNDTVPLMTEVNTLPGLTNHSLLPKSAKYDGMNFNSLILTILKSARLDYKG